MREYRLMPWQIGDLTIDELTEIVKDQDAHHKAMRSAARRKR